MPNMTIQEAAQHLGVSKEAIHNRVRRGSLSVNVVDGVKYVDIDGVSQTTTSPKSRNQTRRKSSLEDDRYYKLLEEQNSQLQSKVEKLENETRTLRDQKEQMLISEREKIEQIYKEKDEQLKNILSTISSQFMLNTPMQIDEGIEHLDAEIEVQESEPKGELISLKRYLKTLDVSPKKQKKIQKRFKSRAKEDERIITLGSKLYVDTVRFNYEDIL